MIVVTGATGKAGRAVVERLLDLVPPEQVGVSVRDPGKVQELAERVPDDEYRDQMVERGLPPERASMLLGIFQASRQGGFTAVSPTLEHLIGRPPTPLRDYIGAALRA